MSEEVKAAANSYKQNFTTSGDPLYKLVSKIGCRGRDRRRVSGQPDARLVAGSQDLGSNS